MASKTDTRDPKDTSKRHHLSFIWLRPRRVHPIIFRSAMVCQ